MSLEVLHLDTEFGWRGGQQQLAYLASAMTAQTYDSAVACQPKSRMAQFCRENQIAHYPIRMHNELDLFAGYRLAALCRRKGFKLLHLHCAHAVAIGLWAKLFHRKLKLIATRRVDFALQGHFFSRLKNTNPWLDKIVCISAEIERVMRSCGLKQDQLTTITSGVDLDKYKAHKPPADFKKRFGLTSDAFIVGTIAAMVGHKDYPTLLKAAQKVLDQNQKVVFLAVGDGPLEPEIKALAKTLGLENRFIFAGYQTQVGDFLKSFDLFVLSSNQEGLGTSILDAQAAGIPVAACAAGGIPEMIADGVNGRLVPPETPDLLATVILELARDEDQRNRLAREAQNSVKAFSIENTVAQYLALYRSLLK